MNFFDFTYTEVEQNFEVDVVFTFPSPHPMQTFDTLRPTVLVKEIGFEAEIEWLSMEPRCLFRDIYPVNGVRVCLSRGTFTLAKNSNGAPMFEFAAPSGRLYGYTKKEKLIDYNPETIPTLEELSASLKLLYK